MRPIANLIGDYLSWACEGRRAVGTLLPMLFYRGHECEAWELLPSLCRQKIPIEVVQQFETETISEFRARFGLSDWEDLEVLAFAGHHGAPRGFWIGRGTHSLHCGLPPRARIMMRIPEWCSKSTCSRMRITCSVYASVVVRWKRWRIVPFRPTLTLSPGQIELNAAGDREAFSR